MFKRSSFVLASTMAAAAFLFVFVAVVQVQPAASDDDDEARREMEMALAAESGALTWRPPNLYPGGGGGGPLFVGVSDASVYANRIDPATAAATPVFSGTAIWGSAYDPASDQVFFNSGTVLWQWPVGGVPSMIGTITLSGTGTALSMVSLAFYSDTLYSTRNIGGDTGEGIYWIDTTTAMATLVATYTVGSAGLDIGGLAANPATGKFYGTNDTATPVGRGLVELDLSGNATLIAPYPDGQTDIDGLAFGYDRAYLVTDEPGFIYVYDFAVMTYTAPITNPWTTSETFSAGAWIPPPGNPSIALTKTVGLDPNACGTTDSLSVEGPADVTYCYTVINTGDISFTTHYLIDSQLGNIFDGYPAELNPGATLFVTRTALVTQTTVNTATWTARDPIGAPGTASATATVAVTPTFVVYMPYLSSPPSSSAAPARIPVAVRLPPWLSIGLLVLLPAVRRRSE